MAFRRHSIAQIRYQRRRYIAKRLDLIRRLYPYDCRAWYFEHAWRLSKWNLVCSCGLCRDEKYRDGRAREKSRVRRTIDEEWGEGGFEIG